MTSKMVERINYLGDRNQAIEGLKSMIKNEPEQKAVFQNIIQELNDGYPDRAVVAWFDYLQERKEKNIVESIITEMLIACDVAEDEGRYIPKKKVPKPRV